MQKPNKNVIKHQPLLRTVKQPIDNNAEQVQPASVLDSSHTLVADANTQKIESQGILPADLLSQVALETALPKKRKKSKEVRNAKGRQKEKKSKRNKPSISNRTIDGMYRNAYRVQLDMLALSATKANIMISLNGLLISILIISGTHFINMQKLYTLPIVVLLAFSSLAIVFSVLAASTARSNNKFSVPDFDTNRANLLLFSDFSNLTKTEYVSAMTCMQSSEQRMYETMSAHLHELGLNANASFRKLYYSYTAFIIGILVALLSIGGIQWITHTAQL